MADEVDEVFIGLARQHHLHNGYIVVVRIAQPVDKPALFAQSAQHVGYLRSAAVHKHDADTDQRKQHKVGDNRFLQARAEHRAATVFYNDCFSGIFLYVGQRLGQHARLIHV